MTVGSSETTISGVIAPALTVTTAGGATATLLSGPTPSSGTVPAGGSLTFTWTYRLNAASTGAGSVVFSNNAFTAGATTLPASVSNSVLVTRPLTFTVSVNSGSGRDSIDNIASIQTNEFRGTYAVANSTSGGTGDRLLKINGTTVTDAGSTGTNYMRALALNLDSSILYGVDRDSTAGSGADRIIVNTATSNPAPVSQWASSVVGFSSQYSTTDWSAAQALGAPNTTSAGDYATAWSPATNTSSPEYLHLGFTTPVYATSVRVRETYRAPFVTGIELVEPNGTVHVMSITTDTTTAPGYYTFTFPKTSYLVDEVIIRTTKSDYEEIDAVELTGTPQGSVMTALGRCVSAGNPLNGSLGSITVADIRGMAFDPETGVIFAIHRREDATNGNTLLDCLFEIDPETGLHIDDAFGTGVDYVTIATHTLSTPLYNIDDLAFDPVSGILYGTANDSTAAIDDLDRLVIIDKATGAVTNVGRYTVGATTSYVTNVQGMSFDDRGVLRVSTGSGGTTTTALTANYYSGTSLGSLVLSRAETSIDNGWSTGSPHASVPVDNFSARWDGSLRPTSTGNHTFQVVADDGVRLWVNNVLVIDQWKDQSATTYSATVALTAGVTVPVRMEYYEKSGSAEARLRWSGPTFAMKTITEWVTDTSMNRLWTVNSTNGRCTLQVSPTITFPAYTDFEAIASPVSPVVIPPTPSNLVQTGLTGSIGDLVYADANANGVRDAGETGVAGVRILVSSGSTTKEATTDGSGSYRVFGLTANSGTPWNVAVDLTSLPSNWVMTTSPTLQRTLASNSTAIDDADFGIYTPATTNGATLGGFVYTDADENGVFNGDELPIQNVSVQLYRDVNSSGALDGGDLLVRGAVTAENGFYLFSSLNPGAYLVDVTENSVPAGMDYVSGGAAVRPVTLVALQTRTDVNYGFNHTGSIGDLVFYDTDNDGVKDAGESGIPNVRVSVYLDENNNDEVDASENELGIGFTNASGIYSIGNLPAGEYVVRVDEQHVPAPVGSPNAGLYNTMLPTNGEEIAVTLAVAEAVTTADFGFAELGALEGFVFNDANYSTVRDTTEAGVANINISLVGMSAGGSAVNRTTVTNASGEYSLLVPAGTYSITFNTSDPDFPAGMTQNTTATTHDVTIQGGWELENLNFGRAYAGALGGLVFADSNGNGGRDGGEGPVLGAVVELFDSTGTTYIDSRTVGADATYRFSGLANGTYVIKVNNASLTTMVGSHRHGGPAGTAGWHRQQHDHERLAEPQSELRLPGQQRCRR
jgi:hypothetical protein